MDLSTLEIKMYIPIPFEFILRRFFHTDVRFLAPDCFEFFF